MRKKLRKFRKILTPILIPVFKVINLYRKIPKLIWGAFAVFGIFSIGFIVGIYAISGANTEPYKSLYKQNTQLLNLIGGYEDMGRLYRLQGQNVGVIIDPDIIYNHPEEFTQALNSIKSYRDQILIEQGVITERRHQAGFIDSPAK